MTGPTWWHGVRLWWHDRQSDVDAGAHAKDAPRVVGWNQPVQPNAELVLASSDSHFHFQARVHVGCAWTGEGHPPPSPIEIAREGVWRRAQNISARRSLAERRRLRGELEVELCRPQLVADTGVRAWAHCVAVEADPDLVAAVEQREASLQREVVDSWEKGERARREQRLRELIADPVRATTWWFADNQDKPEDLEKIAESFQRLRAILEPDLLSGAGRDTWGRILADFVEDADPAARNYLALRLGELFAHFGRHDLADRLRALPQDATSP